MKTYTIYHIPGTKIGCTSDLVRRLRDQGFTDCEILEEHTDINLASTRERELQEEFEYPVDKDLYSSSARKGRKYFTIEEQQRGGLLGSVQGTINLKKLTSNSKHQSKASKAANSKIRTCKYCGHQGNAAPFYRHHRENCKLKA